MKYFNNLQALRAVAALMVVAHHATDSMLVAFPALRPVNVGQAGVDLFFVISGVVITLAHHHRSESPLLFLKSRVIRIVPMYWMVTFLMLALMAVGFRPFGRTFSNTGMDEILKSLFFIPFGGQFSTPIMFVGWTLNYEMFFYALFAVFLVFEPRRRVLFCLTSITLLVLLGFILQPQGMIAQTYTSLLLLEFAAGMVLGHMWAERRPRDSDRVVGIALLAAASALLVLVTVAQAHRLALPHRTISFGLPAFLAVAGATFLEAGKVRTTNRVILLLGAASYVLYLFHPIVQSVVLKTLDLGSIKTSVAVGSLIYFAAALAVPSVVALLIHLYMERPITELLRGRTFASAPAT